MNGTLWRTKRRKQNQKTSFHFLSGSPHTPRRKRIGKEVFGFVHATRGSVRGAQHSLHHAIGAYDIICFGNRCELGTIETPEWNLAVENQPRSGRAVGTPTLFRLIFQTNSDSRLRRDAGFFRQEAGAKSEAILTDSICLIQKEFLLL